MRSQRAAAPCGCCPGLVVARTAVLDCRAGRVERISGHGPFLALMCMLLHRQACAAHSNNVLLRMYSAQGFSVALRHVQVRAKELGSPKLAVLACASRVPAPAVWA